MATRQMVVNYVPGEECRVAIVEDGKLEEFHAERMDGPSSHVNNIYVGKVVNVEPAIQAAFVDFGLEHNGFLHVSDVHPQYFPGEDYETTERVGKKTPRRDRPPIQDCFRRGDEVAVQVLKEGVGTKGPTVTSYLSIPGRFLVMMPQMDRVGVSRKVEDEETRRKMREILDQLDLPEGFGFILRTAGMERSKAELKRDLAYLMRLWKDMEKRWRSGNKPRLLYSESDLLVRALRDILTADIDQVIVDNEAALNRSARFLKIVSPRTTTKLVHFTGHAPIFHAMGVEPQVQMIHAREVPLPSGGRLVIDEAEALVAIDVNSGKSRDARDAETNAYQTNLEAVDEICRQLRLRDVGGVIVNDLIDMRFIKHRRDIENRFRDNLKKDRARWTISEISEFGILEMTRQRMRGSHESQHFTDCPTCRGRGLVQRPDSVAADAMRELAAIMDAPKVTRVEMVVHPRIAGELLSGKRRALSRLERVTGKHVDVRVSDAIAVDRVTFYAYDDRGADLDVSGLGKASVKPEQLVAYEITADQTDEWAEQAEQPEPVEPEEPEPEMPTELHPIEMEPEELAEITEASSRQGDRGDRGRRGRRGRDRDRGRDRGRDDRGRPAHPQPAHDQRPPEHGEHAPEPAHAEHADGAQGPPAEGDGQRRRRRRRGRRGRGGGQGAPLPSENGTLHNDHDHAPQDQAEQAEDSGDGPYTPAHAQEHAERPGEPAHAEPAGPGEDGDHPRRRRRRRRGRRGRGGEGADQVGGDQPHSSGEPRQPGHERAKERDFGGSLAAAFAAEARSTEPTGEPPAAGPGDHPAQEGDEHTGPRRRRRRRGRGRGDHHGEARHGEAPAGGHEPPHPPREHDRPAPPPAQPTPAKPKPRPLYATRRKLGPGEIKKLGGSQE